MADAEIKVVGFEQLAAGSKVLFGRIGKTATSEFAEVAQHAAEVVRGRVPRDSGRLRGSVSSEKERDRAIVRMGRGVPYAGWIEFGGTRGRDYYPQGRYLMPVGVQAEPQIVAAANHAANREIGGMTWKQPPTPT